MDSDAAATRTGYRETLRAALSTCDELRFVTFDQAPLRVRTRELIDSLAGLLRRSEETTEWPGTLLHPGAGGRRVWTYTYSPEAVDAVLARSTGMSDWIGELPEDPTCCAGTVRSGWDR